MSANTASQIKITTSDLAKFLKRSTELLTGVTYNPTRDVESARAARAPDAKPTGLVFSQNRTAESKSMSVIKVAGDVNQGDELMDENINAALNIVRTGLQIGLHIGSLFRKFSGLERLQEANATGQLKSDTDQKQWRSFTEAHAAITLFVAASYVSWKLANYKTEELSGLNVDFVGLPEPLQLRGQIQAIAGALYHWGSYLKGAQTGLEVLKVTQLFFKAVFDDIKAQSAAFEQSAAVFVDKNYQLEGTSFTITGFQGEVLGTGTTVEFNRVSYGEIVGNRDAIHQSRRVVQRIVAGYNPKDKQNPFQKLGGIARVRMGKGIPGTGKSKIIAANATYFKDLCEALGRPFLFSPLPDTIVSTFQGGSAERMVAWMQPFSDPSRIAYGPMDDAENSFEDRSRQGVSAGVREVIGVFLRYTEGAYAIERGNVLFDLMTNLPEQLDPAILSRIQDRFDVNGARTVRNFLDQDYLWWSGLKKMVPGFITQKDPDDYVFLSDQKLMHSASEMYQSEPQPEGELLAHVFEEVQKSHSTDEHALYAALFVGVQKYFPLFSSRDVRNIQRAISGRLMDFDMPSDWFENPEMFADQPYDRRMAMVVELMQANTKGLSFSDVRFQETVRYLNTMTSISEDAFRRKVDERRSFLRMIFEADEAFKIEKDEMKGKQNGAIEAAHQ